MDCKNLSSWLTFVVPIRRRTTESTSIVTVLCHCAGCHCLCPGRHLLAANGDLHRRRNAEPDRFAFDRHDGDFRIESRNHNLLTHLATENEHSVSSLKNLSFWLQCRPESIPSFFVPHIGEQRATPPAPAPWRRRPPRPPAAGALPGRATPSATAATPPLIPPAPPPESTGRRNRRESAPPAHSTPHN